MSSVIYFFFSDLYGVIPFSCLIALVRNFSPVLNNIGESRCICSVPLSIMLVVGLFVDDLCLIVLYCHLFLFFMSFVECSALIWSCYFFFFKYSGLCQIDYIEWFSNIGTLLFINESHLFMVYNSFLKYTAEFYLLIFCLRLHPYSWGILGVQFSYFVLSLALVSE